MVKLTTLSASDTWQHAKAVRTDNTPFSLNVDLNKPKPKHFNLAKCTDYTDGHAVGYPALCHAVMSVLWGLRVALITRVLCSRSMSLSHPASAVNFQ